MNTNKSANVLFPSLWLESVNQSLQTHDDHPGSPKVRYILSTATYYTTLYCLICIAIAASLLGAIANILIIIIYKKMDLSTSPSINISYLSMAISDLLTCVTTLLWAVLIIPNFDSYGFLPVVSKEILIPLASWPALAFTKTTALITAWIALERCLCIVYPLQIKDWITRRCTALVIATIYFITIPPVILVNFVFRYELKTSEIFPNKTVLGVRRVHSPQLDFLYDALLSLYGQFYQWIPLTIIILCTFFLVSHLKYYSELRYRYTIIMRKTPRFVGSLILPRDEAGAHTVVKDPPSERKTVSKPVEQTLKTSVTTSPKSPERQPSTGADGQSWSVKSFLRPARIYRQHSGQPSTSIDPQNWRTTPPKETPEEESNTTLPDSLHMSAIAEAVNEPDVRRFREKRVIKAVLLVAIFSIIFTTPPSVVILIYILFPDLRPLGPYDRFNKILNFFGGILLMFNACFNVFIYYRLGARFRVTLKRTLHLDDQTETSFLSTIH